MSLACSFLSLIILLNKGLRAIAHTVVNPIRNIKGLLGKIDNKNWETLLLSNRIQQKSDYPSIRKRLRYSDEEDGNEQEARR